METYYEREYFMRDFRRSPFISHLWNTTVPTVVQPPHLGMLQGSRRLVIAMTVFGGELQYQALQSVGGFSLPFEQALTLISLRYVTREEEYVYGILGMCKGGDAISIEYDISWHRMLEKLQISGLLTEWQLASSTVNPLPGLSCMPRGHYGYYDAFRNMETLAALVPGPRLSWSERGPVVMGVPFKWVKLRFGSESGDQNNIRTIRGQPYHYARGRIRFPGNAPHTFSVCARLQRGRVHQEENEGDARVALSRRRSRHAKYCGRQGCRGYRRRSRLPGGWLPVRAAELGR